jgi:cytochrome c-type biogenesis protein CcmH/NrfG
MSEKTAHRNRTTSTDPWTGVQAYTLAVVCLLIGIAGGWFIRGPKSPATAATAESSSSAAVAGMGGQQMPRPDQMKKMADTQAAPLLDKLRSDPNNAELLANIGNVYYDTQQYPTAIDYYQRALKVTPENTSVRTDLGTALWYMGDADGAIHEFNRALQSEPNKSNALFNLGIVKWQGKMDVDGAVSAWQKLLDTNPNYEGRDKVQQLMAQAKKHSGVQPGTPAKALPE